MATVSEAHGIIRRYSITWFDPITSMPPGLNEATSSAYLLMRGIDEIEDHPELTAQDKDRLLQGVSAVFQERCKARAFTHLFSPYEDRLPAVTLRMSEWSMLAPNSIAPRIHETFAAMAERMAAWGLSNWQIHTEADLDRYTYAVGSVIALLLSDLWAWHDGTKADRTLAVAYGRALQAGNICVDRETDLARGVRFWPDGWSVTEIKAYAERELALASQYVAGLPKGGHARRFSSGPVERYRQAIHGGLDAAARP